MIITNIDDSHECDLILSISVLRLNLFLIVNQIYLKSRLGVKQILLTKTNSVNTCVHTQIKDKGDVEL